jgi:hypothetical protein
MLSCGVMKLFALFIAMFEQWTVHSEFPNSFFLCEVSNSACKGSYFTLNSFHLINFYTFVTTYSRKGSRIFIYLFMFIHTRYCAQSHG